MPAPIVANSPRYSIAPSANAPCTAPATSPAAAAPNRAVFAHHDASIESLAEVHNESLPFNIGELSIEIDCLSDANREPKEGAPSGRASARDQLRRLAYLLGRDPHLTTNFPKLGQREAFARRQLAPVSLVLRLARLREDRGDFGFVESSLGHGRNGILVSGHQASNVTPA